MKKQQRLLAREQLKVDRFNEDFKPGDPVIVKNDLGAEFKDQIKAPASIIGGHTGMAWLLGKGSYLIERVLRKEVSND